MRFAMTAKGFWIYNRHQSKVYINSTIRRHCDPNRRSGEAISCRHCDPNRRSWKQSSLPTAKDCFTTLAAPLIIKRSIRGSQWRQKCFEFTTSTRAKYTITQPLAVFAIPTEGREKQSVPFSGDCFAAIKYLFRWSALDAARSAVAGGRRTRSNR